MISKGWIVSNMKMIICLTHPKKLIDKIDPVICKKDSKSSIGIHKYKAV